MRPYLPSPIAARSWRLGTISAPFSSPMRRSTHQRLRSLPRAPRPVSPPTVFGPCSPAKFGSCSDRPVVSALMLDEIGAALDLVVRAPRHDRHRGGRVLRRAFDEAVGIHHVDQDVALDVAAAHDLHLLEEQRAAFAEDVVALLELGLDADRPNLPAGERDVRHLLGDADPALEPALL